MYLTDLRRMLRKLEASIEETDPPKRAPLYAQWRALRADIDRVETRSGKRGGGVVDEIARRRVARAAEGDGDAGAVGE